MERIEESYLENHLQNQLKNHLGKRVRVWAAYRQRNWRGVLLQIGSDFIKIGKVRNETVVKHQYLLLSQIVLIESDE